MNRVDRLMGMVTVLQSKKFVAAEYLSEKFGISVRTVYRDIRALNEIGVPVSFEPNRGYFITHGYFLPPVAFSAEEANALVLMETIAEKFGDRSIKKNYETALNKIKAVMRGADKEKVEHLHAQIRIYRNPAEQQEFEYLALIQQAITNRTVLKIEYRNNQQVNSKREVEPIGLTFYSMSWHMIAWCWKRNDYRDFKTPHILRLIPTEAPFRKKEHIDINGYIAALHARIEEEEKK